MNFFKKISTDSAYGNCDFSFLYSKKYISCTSKDLLPKYLCTTKRKLQSAVFREIYGTYKCEKLLWRYSSTFPNVMRLRILNF